MLEKRLRQIMLHLNHYWNIKFECSLNVMKQVVIFKKKVQIKCFRKNKTLQDGANFT